MSSSPRLTRMHCFVTVPRTESGMAVRDAIHRAARQAGWSALSDQFQNALLETADASNSFIARSDCIVADVTNNVPNVLLEVGIALAMDKTIVLVAQEKTAEASLQQLAIEHSEYPILQYSASNSGLTNLTERLSRTFKEIRTLGRRPRKRFASRTQPLYVADWDRLDHRDVENLVRELLISLGYRQIDWFVSSRLADIAAILPRKDPDGFEYREIWIISFSFNEHSRSLLIEPDYLLHRIMMEQDSLENLESRNDTDPTITFLFVSIDKKRDVDLDLLIKKWGRQRRTRGPRDTNVRLRVWNRDYLTSLIQQYPQIGYKYFSEEARWEKYRKTPEELYQENTELTQRLTIALGDLESEKNLRIRAERDAVWKDISFSAAHKIGNPIFAIETDLQSLERRLDSGKMEERISKAREVVPNMHAAVERAKAIIDQFKSLANTQIRPSKTILKPILRETCHPLETEGISLRIECPDDLSVFGDSEKLSEVFEELVTNASRWLAQKFGAAAKAKQVSINAALADPKEVPSSLESGHQYAVIHFKDNGPGVSLDRKASIFDAFTTTYIHGTGLGLALVRRLIEAHGGAVSEVGIPGEGADFIIFLPSAGSIKEPTPLKRRSAKSSTTAD